MDEQRGAVGCDPHKHTVTFAAVDVAGMELAAASFANDSGGFHEIACWLGDLSIDIVRVGIEGSASWGRHLSAFLASAGYDVREVPSARTSERRRRRRRPKTDREDALAIARETLGDPDLPPAKPSLSISEALGELTVICQQRRSLIRRRQRLLNEAEGLLNKLPPDLRVGLPTKIAPRLRVIAGLEVSTLDSLPALAHLLAWLRELAQDLSNWEARIKELEFQLEPLLFACGSTLTEEVGIGIVSAAELLAAVVDPSRFRTEGAFGRWCGVAPVAVSSGEGHGEPIRHRLDRLGNRQMNRILYTMSVTQARHLPLAQAFLSRKQAEGKSKKEARRAHMRQLAKRVIRRMWTDQARLEGSTKERGQAPGVAA